MYSIILSNYTYTSLHIYTIYLYKHDHKTLLGMAESYWAISLSQLIGLADGYAVRQPLREPKGRKSQRVIMRIFCVCLFMYIYSTLYII